MILPDSIILRKITDPTREAIAPTSDQRSSDHQAGVLKWGSPGHTDVDGNTMDQRDAIGKRRRIDPA